MEDRVQVWGVCGCGDCSCEPASNGPMARELIRSGPSLMPEAAGLAGEAGGMVSTALDCFVKAVMHYKARKKIDALNPATCLSLKGEFCRI